MGILTPLHCPLAALPGLRRRMAPSLYILICGLGWPPPRSGACWPAPGVTPGQGGPQCCVCLQKLLGWAQGVSWACKPPILNHVFSSPPSEQGRGLEWPGGGWGQDVPSLLGFPHAYLSVSGSWAPRPAPPAHYFLACLLLGSWSFKGWRAQV